MNLFTVAVIVFLFNIPFGYWRANTKKFSLQWILAIHLPVPVVIALRLLSGLGFQFITYPVLVAAFFAGQFFGKYLNKKLNEKKEIITTSCLFTDIIRNRKILFH